PCTTRRQARIGQVVNEILRHQLVDYPMLPLFLDSRSKRATTSAPATPATSWSQPRCRWATGHKSSTDVFYINGGTIVNKVLEDAVLDRAYAALADPTRRALLTALRDGRARISDLARPFPITFAGVSRQLKVLEAAGLVDREIRGREHWLSARPEGL